MNAKARFALLLSVIAALFLACSGDDNGGGPNHPLGDGGPDLGDGSSEAGGPCDCSSVACQGAPPLDPTVVASFYEANRFIYEGVSTGQCVGHPLQSGVATGTIDADHAAVLQGKVLDANSAPLPGVALTVVGHPEFGSTVSAPDGTYQLAVNGGGQLTVRYVKTGNIVVQRHVPTKWLSYARLPDVVMRSQSTTSTAIALGATSSFADGDTVTDADGTRTSHVYVAPNTKATAIAQDGTKTSLSSFHLRMTELTSGATGQASMPADLPPTSAYTYCTAFDVEEAPDAARVELSPPAIAYVDDFLGAVPGTGVPAGAYQPATDAWEGASNGLTIKVLTAGASPTVDIRGEGAAASSAELAAVGITSDELAAIGARFAAGAMVWRVALPHFSFWDFNFGFWPPAGAVGPQGSVGQQATDNSSCTGGSILRCESQTLGEVEPLVGTPLSLMYSSERHPSYAPSRTASIQLSGATIPSNLEKITRTIDIAGQHFVDDFAPTANLIGTFTWDGKDAFGRAMQGVQTAVVTIDYWYAASYQQADVFAGAGTGIYVVTLAGHRQARADISLRQVLAIPLVAWDERGRGENGWALAQHHVLDPYDGILFFGDGERESVETIGTTIQLHTGAAGTFAPGIVGDGGPATAARIYEPNGLAIAPDGTTYISEEGNNAIRKIDPSGVITTIAGNGTAGYSGDGGPAKNAQLNAPWDLALDTDGSLYVADSGNHRVRKIAPNGTITTVAGTGSSTLTFAVDGDGGPATASNIFEPMGLAFGPDHSLYVIDHRLAVLRKVSPNGIITTIAGALGTSGVIDGGGAASQAQLGSPTGVDVAPDGTIYVADGGRGGGGLAVVWRIRPSGIIDRFAGTVNQAGYTGDGGAATAATLSYPVSVAVGPDGVVYISDGYNSAIRAVDPNGTIRTAAGGGTYQAVDVSPLDSKIYFPQQLRVDGSNHIYVGSWTVNQVYRFGVTRPIGFGASYVVPSYDGRQAFVFDRVGHHLRTVDAVTGVPLLSFTYDGVGRVSSVIDRDANATTLARDGSGCVTSVTSPWGHVTSMTCDSNGYLATVTDPAAAKTSFTSSTDGLLETRVAPNGDTNTFTYDSAGRIAKDAEPWGGYKTLTHTDLTNGWSTAITTAQNRTTAHDITNDAVTGETRTTHLPDGHTATSVKAPDQARTITSENKSVVATTAKGDPRFNMMAPVMASGSYSTPLGNAVSISQTRAVTLGAANDPTAPVTYSETATVGGHAWTRAYHATTRTWLVTTPEERTEQVALDAKGHVVEVDAPNRAPVQTAYDAQGRVKTVTQGARAWGLTYDARSNLASSTDALSHTWSYAYDAVGRTTGVTRADTQKIRTSFDVNGNVTSVTPPGKAGHDFTYTAGDVAKAYKPPTANGTAANDTITAFSQDLDLTTLTRADSQVVGFGYDTAGRLASTTSSVGVETLSWNPLTGELGSVTDSNGENISFATDGDLVTGVTWSGPVAGAVGYQYDTVLRISQETAGGTAISYAYDNDNLVTTAGAESLTRYAADGYLSSTSIGVASDALTYSEYGELATHVASVSGSAIFSQNFTRDTIGRVSSLVETVDGAQHTYGYSYDLADRLATVTIDGAAASSYVYDANGNATATTVRGASATGVYDAQDRLTSYGGATYDWTAQGELLAKHLGTATTSYATDSLGRLQSVSLPNGHVVSYVYDGSNRRVGKKLDGVLQQGFLYRDATKPVVELDGAGNVVSRFVYGSSPLVPDYVVRGGSTYKIFADQIGSPRVVVDVSSGTVVERIDYDERGNTLKDTNPGFIPFGFAGGIVDRDTGLIRFGTRDCDPSSGRWTTKDSIGFDGGLNFYSYAGGDAVNRVDPSGKFFWVAFTAGAFATADLVFQLAENGGRVECVNWWQVGGAGLVGAGVGVGVGGLFAAEVEAGISTPWGLAVQEASPEAEAALGDAQDGATLYRQGVFGQQQTGAGQFWSLENPAGDSNFANNFGLPASNSGSPDWIMGGQLNDGAAAVTRGAPAIGPNGGGAIEVVTSPGDVGGLWFHMPD